MAKHKAPRRERKNASPKTRTRGPGRHSTAAPVVDAPADEVETPVIETVVEPDADVPVERDADITVEAVSTVGLSSADEVADAWTREAEQIVAARRQRQERAEARRVAREEAARVAAEEAAVAAQVEAERIRALRELPAELDPAEEQLLAALAGEAVSVEVVNEQVESAGEDVVEVEVEVAEPIVEEVGPEGVETPDADDNDDDGDDDDHNDDDRGGNDDDDDDDGGSASERERAGFDALVFGEPAGELPALFVEALIPAVEDDAAAVAPVLTAEAELTDDDVVEAPELAAADVAPVIAFDDFDLVEAADDDDDVAAELIDDATADEANPQQVHIHHHYHEKSDVPAQILIAPAVSGEQAGDFAGLADDYVLPQPPAVVYPGPQPETDQPEAQPEPETDTFLGADIVFIHEEDTGEERLETGPIDFEKPKREPLFTWRGKPIGGGAGGGTAPRATETGRPVQAIFADPEDWFEKCVQDAIAARASDLHMVVEEGHDGVETLTSRIRVDGFARQFRTVVGDEARTIMNKFKATNNLSTSGSFAPEESVYDVVVDGEPRKARISLMRTYRGGDALAIRLPASGPLMRLSDLGMADNNYELTTRLLASSNRMLLFAGPMGSGKTTGAHAAVLEVSRPERVIYSLEDPVERQLPDVTQLEVDAKNGAGYDVLLPSLVRQDYDTLFLGEIRDPGTAASAVSIAQAGRQVISTIHGNDNISALIRLINLNGAQENPMDVLDSVAGVISQRLIAKLNPEWDGKNPTTKYKGRVPINEALRITPQLIEAFMNGTALPELQRIAAESAATTFLADAQRLVDENVTDVDEVGRVLGL